MEQIIITRLDGSKHPIVNRKDACYMTSASQSIALLGADTVTIQVKSTSKQEYFIGDKIEVYGRVYKLNRIPKVNKEGAHSFTYDLEFEGIQYDLARCTYDLTIDTTNNELQDVSSNSLIGDLRIFAEVLVSNANRVFAGKWVLGDVPDTVSDKNLTFGESDNCLSVLQKLCTEFDTEFEIAQSGGINTIHFKKVGQTFAHQFVYGRGGGLYNLSRQNVSTDNIITRLKVYGSTENITAKYRALRLCLPNKNKGASYIESPELVAKYGVWEGAKYFDDVKPSRTGKITSIGSSIKEFVDNQMNFDLNEKDEDGETVYLLSGVAAKIHFNTGNLAGYDFELSNYDHATKTFRIIPVTDERGMSFPSESSAAFRFQAGDEYKILDISLPQTYIDAAEAELASKGDMEYQQVSQPQVQYSLKVTQLWLENLLKDTETTNFFMPGDYIPIKDTDVDVDKNVRVQTIKRDILDEYVYDLTISDTTTTASLASQVVAELKEIDTTIKTNHLNDPAKARNNWRSTREVLSMVFDTEGDYYSDKIKPLSIDTSMLSVGAKSMQFTLQDNKFVPNLNGNANQIGVTGGKLIHYTIVENGARIWTLNNTTVTLESSTKAYYIYAKCKRDASDGYVIFSENAITAEEDTAYYHFLLGVLNSVDPVMGIRTISLMYGFTTVNGKYITTGVIQSTDGKNYFDLDGNKFKIGNDSNSLSFNENGDGKLRLKGAMIISPSGEESVPDTFRGAWSSSTVYYEGDVVTYASAGKTSSYRYCSTTPRSGVIPGTSEYWMLTASGGADGAVGISAKHRDYLYINSVATDRHELEYELYYLPSYMGTDEEDTWLPPEIQDWSRAKPSMVSGKNRWATYRDYDTKEQKWGNFVPEYIDTNWAKNGESAPAWFVGDYSSSKSYTGSTSRRDVVNWNDHAYIAKTSAGSFSNKTPDNTSYWEPFGLQVKSIATELLLAEGANIANFIFHEDKLTSQKQTDGVPNLSLNGLTGMIKMLSGEIGDFKILDNDIVGQDDAGIERIRLSMDKLPTQNMIKTWDWATWDVVSYSTGGEVSDNEITSPSSYSVRYERDENPGGVEENIVEDKTYLNCKISFQLPVGGEVRIRCSDFFRTSFITADTTFQTSGTYSIKDSDNSEIAHGNIELADIEFNAPFSGKYYLEVEVQGEANSTRYDYEWQGKMGIDISGITYSRSPQKTMIGADGFTSYFGSQNHLYYKQGDMFSCIMGAHGLRITGNGIERTSNGGNTWNTL